LNHQTHSSALVAVGLTALIAGMILLEVGAWLEDLEGRVGQE